MPLANALLTRGRRWTRPEARYPAGPRVLPELRARPDHARPVAAGGAVPRVRLLLVGLRRRWSSTPAAIADRMIARARPRRRQPRRRDRQQRRLPAPALRRARDPGARHRPGPEHRRGGHARAASRRSPSSSAPSVADELARDRAGARTSSTPTTCSPTSPTSTASSRGSPRSSSRRRRRRHRDALRARPGRAPRVRHDLPRARLLLLAHGARRGSSATTAWSSSTSSGIPIHGGSLRVFVAHAAPAASSRAGGRRAARRGGGARASRRSTYFSDFAARVDGARRGPARAARRACKARGEPIAAYGAAAKGAVLLNAFGIGTETHRLRRRSQPPQAGPLHARGRTSRSCRPSAWSSDARRRACCSPGTSPTRSSTSRASTVQRGGRFIIPIPEPQVV